MKHFLFILLAILAGCNPTKTTAVVGKANIIQKSMIAEHTEQVIRYSYHYSFLEGKFVYGPGLVTKKIPDKFYLTVQAPWDTIKKEVSAKDFYGVEIGEEVYIEYERIDTLKDDKIIDTKFELNKIVTEKAERAE